MRDRMFPRWGAALAALFPLSEILYTPITGQTMYAAALASLLCALVCAGAARLAPHWQRSRILQWVLALAALWPLVQSLARMGIFLRETVFRTRPLWTLLLLLAVILHIVSKRTVFGRHVFAVGSNERTTRLSGINVNRVKLGVYALMGAVVAIAALLQVSRIGAMDPANAGSGYELDAIAAVIVGGTSMSGGKGSVVGTVFGMLIIAVMNNLLNLLGVDPFLREAFKGAIIIAAVLLQRKSSEN